MASKDHGSAPFVWPKISSEPRSFGIGRASDNDIVIDLPNISVYHARLIIDGAGAMLEDLNSTNGTYLGASRQRIQRSPIAITDVIYLGSHEVLVRELLSRAGIESPLNPPVAEPEASAEPQANIQFCPRPEAGLGVAPQPLHAAMQEAPVDRQPLIEPRSRAAENRWEPEAFQGAAASASAEEPAVVENSANEVGFDSLAVSISAARPIREQGRKPRRQRSSAAGLGTYNIVVLVVGLIGLTLALWLRMNHLKIQVIDVDQVESEHHPTKPR